MPPIVHRSCRQPTLLICWLVLALGAWLMPTRSGAEDGPAETDRPVVKKRGDGEQDAAKGEKKPPVKNPFPNRVPAPELDGGIEWLNTSGEISLKDLRGKVVVLDFWTYCCINCMHVLPDLEYLEKKFEKELVVIGVHSAKFDNEKETGNIRKAILRYEIAHPVINDAKMTVWRKFGVNSWPTFVLIDPEGYFCGAQPGEGNRELFEQAISKLIAYHKSKGTLDETPVQFALERHKQPDGPLKFPGKVLADPAGNRLFISDSNHNRIVISSLEGKLIDVIGSGQIGTKDGGYAEAEFDHPQGMCLVGQKLYVADTENHLLRTVDLEGKTVATLAGTGEQAQFRAKGGPLLKTSLNSPWDVYELDGILYVAMAGPHQIWSHKLNTGVIQPYAGSGREDIINGKLERSALAQPSGIASDGKFLFVVDSEGSSVRKIVAKKHGAESDEDDVTTIAGTSELPNGRSLFEFGDVDGVGEQARLQHPLGIAFHNGQLLVADSYNHKLKLLDPETKRCESWLGTGKPGIELDPVQLSEPAGLTIAGETLYVADTNNHRILTVDLQTRQVAEFTISGLAPPVHPEETSEEKFETDDSVTTSTTLKVKPGVETKIEVGFELPEGYKLNDQIPIKYSWVVDPDDKLIIMDQIVKRKIVEVTDGKVTVKAPPAAIAGKTVLTLALSYGYCKDGIGGVCKVGASAWKITVEASADVKPDPLTLTATPK